MKPSSIDGKAVLLAIAAGWLAAPASAQYFETRIDTHSMGSLDKPHAPEAVRPVVHALLAQDCAGAIKALKSGLKDKNKNTEVMLMAGTMYERGMCVKKNWEQANQFYLMADAAGNVKARHKLVAGLIGQGDAGGGLYWASKLPRDLPAQCYSKADPEKDPDAFAAELNSWPKERLNGCVYMAGVYNAIVGDMRIPSEAAAIGVWGSIQMKFVPATGTIEWTNVAHETRALSGLQVVKPDTPLAHRSGKADQILVNHGQLLSTQALQRFPRPEGIDPSLVLVDKFDFDFR